MKYYCTKAVAALRAVKSVYEKKPAVSFAMRHSATHEQHRSVSPGQRWLVPVVPPVQYVRLHGGGPGSAVRFTWLGGCGCMLALAACAGPPPRGRTAGNSKRLSGRGVLFDSAGRTAGGGPPRGGARWLQGH